MSGKHVKDLSDQSQDKVTIYSGDGGCYWREGACGYTSSYMAGVFTREEAYKLCGHCGPEKRIELHDVPNDHIPTLRGKLTEASKIREWARDVMEWMEAMDYRIGYTGILLKKDGRALWLGKENQ